MRLDEWLFKEEMTVKEFAKQVGYDRTYISGLVSGKRKGNVKAGYTIEKFTKGEVTVEDILENQKTKRKVPPRKK